MRTAHIFVLLLPFIFSNAQNFTWMKGDSVTGKKAVYGAKGVASLANDPGARYGAVSYRDATGNLWLFGGAKTGGGANDLWKYDVSSNLWTWVSGDSATNQWGRYGTKGVASSTVVPGCRQWAVGWTDLSGDFWLFGGWGNPTFGYYNVNPSTLNDLWKYTHASNQWTWMGGDSLPSIAGKYGIKGVASVTNCPGGRIGGQAWTDNSGDLWMFGGSGFPANPNVGLLNDVWKYNIASGAWTWMHGASVTDQNGIYGTKYVSSASNVPGSRYFASGATDGLGNFFLYGGEGYSINSSNSYFLGDLWKYNMTLNEWTWISGGISTNNTAHFGTQGVISSTNTPGGRWGATSFCDSYGNFWLFGGMAQYTLNNANTLNDLWIYQPGSNSWGWIAGNSIYDAGFYGTQGQGTAFTRPNGKRFPGLWLTSSSTLWLLGGQNDWWGGKNWSDLWKYPLPQFLPVNVNNYEAQANLHIFPNPSSGKITVNANDEQMIGVSVYDSNGILLRNEKLFAGEEVDLSNLVDGIYFVRLNNGKNISTLKQVIAR